MKTKDLMAISSSNYRKNGLISHLVFFLLAVLAAAFLLLCLFWVDLFLIIVPLIVIPIFFAAQVVVIALRDEDYLTFGGFFNCFKTYFSPKFASTFRIIKSAIYSFVVYLIFSIVYGFAINLSFYYTNFMNYAGIMTDIFNNVLTNPLDIEMFVNTYKDFFSIIMIYTNVPTLFVSAITFIYLIGINNIGLFDRMNNIQEIGQINKLAHENLLRNYRKEIHLSFIKLNWPLFLLFIIGFGGGSVLGYFYLGTYNGVYTLGIALAILLSFGLYGPFYLANIEALYEAFKDKYFDEKNKFKGKVAESLEDLIKQYENKNDNQDEQ